MKPSDGDAILDLPLPSTLFFPVSANPIGFNHLAACEWILRGQPAIERIVFIPSNGRHPDPTKADADLEPKQRLNILRAALAGVADPDQSHLARLAEQDGEALRIGGGNLHVWEWEFSHDRAVTTAQTIARLREAHPGEESRIHWFAGSDLVERMADPVIFSPPDLAFLLAQCRYAALEREGHPLQAAVQALFQKQGLKLEYQSFSAAEAPRWLAPFLRLSSTQIRHAAEAGDPLGAMLPRAAGRLISEAALYRPGRPAGRLVDSEGRSLAPRSALQLALGSLWEELEQEGALLAEQLAGRIAEARPHSIAVVEATVGGLLTMALAGRSGASRYFKQARFAYDEHAKRALLGRPAAARSAVSEKMAAALAEGMAREAGTDFALAETGMAGPPDGSRRSMKNGLCHIALATPAGTRTASLQLHPFQTRREHQLLFSIRALALARQWLAAAP